MALNCPDGTEGDSIRCQVHNVFHTCCEEHVERLDAVETSGFSVFPEVVRWDSDADWDQFTEVSISGQDGDPPDNTLALTGADGIGRAEGVGGTHGNDRRLYVLDGVEGSDFIAYVSFALETQQAQFGIGLRTSTETNPNFAVVVWNNIFFFADTTILLGHWEFFGNVLLNTNQVDGITTRREPIFSAMLSGNEELPMTLETKTPHLLREGQEIVPEFAGFDALFVSEVETAYEVALSGAPVMGNTQLNVTSGSVDTPDDPDFTPGTTIDLRILASLESWDTTTNLISQFAGGDFGFSCSLDGSGNFVFQYTTDGSTQTDVTSTNPSGFTDNTEHYVRYLFNADNGGGQNVTTFFESFDDGMTWEVIEEITNAGTVSVHDSSADLALGEPFPINGRVKRAELRIDDVVVADPDFEAQAPGTTSFDDSTGKTWTLNGDASIGLGPWTEADGNWSLQNRSLLKEDPIDWRRLGVRLVGNRVWFKSWFVDEPEPDWDDPLRSISSLLPDVLENSGLVAPDEGGVGLLLNHLGDDRSLLVRDFEIHVLR